MASTYQYVATYEWTDNRGQVHRSAPSPALSFTQTDPIDGTHTVDVAIPMLRLTAKRPGRSPAFIVVYRTEASGTTFYQVSSITSPTYNDAGVDSVTFTDGTTDANLVGNAQLYTTGGVVENIPPNPVSSMTIYQNRIVLLDSMEPLRVWYSKQVVPGAPVEFSDLFTQNLDPRGGNATAVATLDEKLIVFKATNIFYLVGQGPDATGGNNDFSSAQQVTTDSGCINPRSIVQTPRGIMYQSTKGIYLLDRSLQVSYIGMDVEAYNAETVTSAQLVVGTNEVRFTLASGIALVYDYMQDQWGVFTNINAVDSCTFQRLFTYLRPDGGVRQETPGVFSDAGNFIKRRIVTSWLQFAGLQGYQRVYRMLLLGEYISPHQLLVQTAYDFNPVFVQEDAIDAATLLDTNAYGGDATYGGGTGNNAVYGGSYPLYQWRIHVARQKCQAIQFSIEDVQSGSDVGEGMSLSGLSLEVGMKRGLQKPPAARSFGGG